MTKGMSCVDKSYSETLQKYSVVFFRVPLSSGEDHDEFIENLSAYRGMNEYSGLGRRYMRLSRIDLFVLLLYYCMNVTEQKYNSFLIVYFRASVTVARFSFATWSVEHTNSLPFIIGCPRLWSVWCCCYRLMYLLV